MRRFAEQKQCCVYGYFDGADTNILFVNVQIIASDLDTGHLPSRTAEDSAHFLLLVDRLVPTVLQATSLNSFLKKT